MEKIELLDISLLDDEKKLREIDHWLKVLNWPNGWHYDLDIIWLLKHIEQLHLPKGATILDAGAGLGVTQFILASRGFNIISLDFTQRNIPRYSIGIFSIELNQKDLGDFEHEYMDWMDYGQRRQRNISIKEKIGKAFNHIGPALTNPERAKYMMKNRFLQRYNPYYRSELSKSHEQFGKITFLRGTFNDIPLSDNQVDLLISVSAFEHNTFEDMADSVVEFTRVIKPAAHMMVTTSAAAKKDWYHEPSKGWNFTQDTLSKWFDVSDNVSYDFDFVMKRITNSEKLKRRISEYYKHTKETGLPYGDLTKAEYIPVGVIKQKVSRANDENEVNK